MAIQPTSKGNGKQGAKASKKGKDTPQSKPKAKTTAKTTAKKTPPKKTSTKAKEKKPKQTRAKYDWVALKQEFLESDHIEASPFIQHKYSTKTALSWAVRKSIIGWTEEKKQLQKELQEKASKEFQTKIQQKWDEVFNHLEEAHVKWLEDLVAMIMDQGKVVDRKRVEKLYSDDGKEVLGWTVEDYKKVLPHLNYFELTAILKHIKLEKGQPTEIVGGDKSKAREFLDKMNKEKQNTKEDPEDSK